MTRPATPGQPSLNELMARFLAAKPADAGPDGEVVPHEVTGGFRATTATAWDEARAAFRLFGVEAEKLPPPPDWAAFAASAPAAATVPLAAGLFPQRVRSVPTCADEPASPAEPVPGFAGLRGWVRKTLQSRSATALLVASGVAAGLGDWSDAEAALAAAEPLCDGDWRAAWENQRAAVLWLRGRGDEAAAAWDGESAPAAFNRGMAAFFGGEPGATAALEDAADRLPDGSGWAHLAKLYLSLARTRG